MNKSLLLLTLFALTTALGQIKDEITLENGRKFLVGQITIEDLKNGTYKNWFESNFLNYQVDSELVKSFSDELKNYNLLLFMGTWCGDSKREVPRIVKVLKEANFPMEQLKLVAVDRRKKFYKKSPGGEEWGLDIRRVPTLILLKDGKEVNRIVETPINSLERDFSSILNGHHYIPNYSKETK